ASGNFGRCRSAIGNGAFRGSMGGNPTDETAGAGATAGAAGGGLARPAQPVAISANASRRPARGPASPMRPIYTPPGSACPAARPPSACDRNVSAVLAAAARPWETPAGGDDMEDALAIILGGGRGTRLFPLTLKRSKPAVPIGGKYRLIDIPI